MERCKNNKWSVVAITLLIGIAVHGYRFFNPMFSHDSLLICQNDAVVKVSLGRFLHPLYLFLRGNISTPYLIGLLAVLWLGISVKLLVDVLELKSKWAAVLIAGIFVCNETFSLTSATYIAWLDVFMFTVLLCVLSLWCFAKFQCGWVLGAVGICVACGLYQSYFQVAVALYMVYVIKELLDGKKAGTTFLLGVKAVGTLLLGLGIYYVVYCIVLNATGIEAADTYNSLSGVSDFTGYSIPLLIVEAYMETLNAFLEPNTYRSGFVALINIISLMLLVAGLIWNCRKNKTGRLELLLMVGIILVLPFGINVVYLIAKGTEHALMTFSFVVPYVLLIMVAERNAVLMEAVDLRDNLKLLKVIKGIAVVLVGVVIWCNAVFAQQVYLKKDLDYQATQTTMSRVLDRMEQTEGYIIGVTKVAFIGNLDDVGTMNGRVGYEDVYGTGFDNNTAITYYETYQLYFENILGYPIVLVSETEANVLAETEDVQNMNKFPAENCCQMVGDTLVVKLR